jgi:AcrR family transcriptional regulator
LGEDEEHQQSDGGDEEAEAGTGSAQLVPGQIQNVTSFVTVRRVRDTLSEDWTDCPARRCGTASESGQDVGVPRIWDESVASHKERLRATIIDATIALVRDRGRHDVAMSAVATRAGIGRATLYNYFPDVDHILAAYVVDEFDGFHAHLDAELANTVGPLARLTVVVRETIAYLASSRHQAGASIVGLDDFSPEAQRLVDAAMGGFRGRLAAVVAEGAEAGLLRSDLDRDFLTHGLHHLLNAARTATMADGRSADEATNDVLSLFLRGAASPRGRRRSVPQN